MHRLVFPKSIFLGAPTDWTMEDRHVLRLFLRRFRVRLWLVMKLTKIKEERREARVLHKRTGQLMRDCGQIRDLDVQKSLLGKTRRLQKRVAKNFDRKVIAQSQNLSRQWPLKRRRAMFNRLQQFNAKVRIRTHFPRSEIQEIVGNLVDKMQNYPTANKKQWHALRRLVRRINYLNELSHQENRSLIGFQKKLGAWHDLEIAPGRLRKEKGFRHSIKKLEKKNESLFKVLKKAQGLYGR